MPVAVSLINMKGGVGKTTLAFNLAWYAAYMENKKVLLIDLDPQANSSQYLMGARSYLDHVRGNKGTVVNIFEQFSPPFSTTKSPSKIDPKSVIVNIRQWNDGSKIDLIPSRLELSWTLKNPTSKDHLLASFLAEHATSYDLIIIDCAPTESILTLSAYRASRYLVVPVKPEFLAAIGLPLLVRSLAEFKSSFGHHDLDILGIVFTDADSSLSKPEQNASRRDVQAIASQEGWYVFKNELGHSDSYPRGARSGQPIFLTGYARDKVKEAFEDLGDEFIKRSGI